MSAFSDWADEKGKSAYHAFTDLHGHAFRECWNAALSLAAKKARERESDGFAQFQNQRDKLLAIKHVEGIATAIEQLKENDGDE